MSRGVAGECRRVPGILAQIVHRDACLVGGGTDDAVRAKRLTVGRPRRGSATLAGILLGSGLVRYVAAEPHHRLGEIGER
jgi:hypothetical protein